jgi:hypothetical protein
MLKQLLNERDTKVAVSKFFNTIVKMIITIKKEYDLPTAIFKDYCDRFGRVFNHKKVILTLL